MGHRPGGAAEAGASLVLTYQSERLEENVRELGAALSDPLLMPCDVTNDEQTGRALRRRSTHGTAASTSWSTAWRSPIREDLARPFFEVVA